MELNRKTSVCFTGHRQIPAAMYPVLIQRLEEKILRLIDEGYDTFIAGGALGFDMLAAEQVLNFRRTYSQIRLCLALPCRDQTLRWKSLAALRRYKEILSAADAVEYMTDLYTDTCMHQRNRWMVDHSTVCLCYCTSQRGGTAYTRNYAVCSGLTVINLGEEEAECSQIPF